MSRRQGLIITPFGIFPGPVRHRGDNRRGHGADMPYDRDRDEPSWKHGRAPSMPLPEVRGLPPPPIPGPIPPLVPPIGRRPGAVPALPVLPGQPVLPPVPGPRLAPRVALPSPHAPDAGHGENHAGTGKKHGRKGGGKKKDE